MNEKGAWDTVGLVLTVLALAGGIVALFYLPFVAGPAAVVLVMVGLTMTNRYRGLAGLATGVVLVGFLVGASIASATGRALY